jgi:hypothetical protein
LVLVVAGALWFEPWTKALQPQQLTSAPAERTPQSVALSPDGKYLAFSDKTGAYLQVIDSAEVHPILSLRGFRVFHISWAPDSTALAVCATPPGAEVAGLFITSIFDGDPPRQLSAGASSCQKHSGHRESHSGIRRKLFAFPPESLFTFSPESCSSSPRNRFHVHPGILFALPRNPHQVDNSKVKPEDKCTIEGKVLNSARGQPLKKAHISLRRMDSTTANASPYGAVTDAAGHFTIANVDPGRYHISADRTGYVRSDNSPKPRSSVPGRALRVSQRHLVARSINVV